MRDVDRVIIDRPTSMTACASIARSITTRSTSIVSSIARQRETPSRTLHESVYRKDKILKFFLNALRRSLKSFTSFSKVFDAFFYAFNDI